ncbi:putative RNA recognition motif domain, mei2/Mei2-like RNA recognition [Lupinus albus]|uniref:Putative RNA recognition motif domain, mei2/Mei2-like RNA recognition n=1 Tax=Lupinus albus TaxID=3870 RepID=A0A6A4Q8E5_LUPAL|nr:putative RNA recognition motif domain, mei2/Mei2-like RNA recognition [Lupinus albus]
MPFQVMDQRGVSASSLFFDDISFHSERNVGLHKQKSIHDQYPQGKNGMVASPGSIFSGSSPLGRNAKSGLQLSQTSLSRESMENLHFGGEEGIVDVLKDSKESSYYHPRSWSDPYMQPARTSYGLIGSKIVTNAVPCESNLFSSSLSEIFSQKLRLMGKDVLSDQPITVGSLPREEPYKSIEEDIIGNILPDEDDLFSGVTGELGYSTHGRTNDDFEDFDLFSSGGGMELEGGEHLNSGKRTSGLDGNSVFYGGSKGKLPLGEQPSRTLFVRNINSNVEDSELKSLFEQYGDIRTIYTACKHRGFVMISYYDLRAAQNAMQALQNRPLRSRKLDIHYSIPKANAPEKDIGHGTLMLSGLDSSALNDDLKRIFGFYGEIKEIYEYPDMNHHKFIEFYDVRAAEAALHALNRIGIAGKQIKLEPGHPSLMQQSHKGQEEPGLGQSITDNLSLTQKAKVSYGALGSGCLGNGYNQGFQSEMRQPLNAFADNAFFQANSSIHNTVGGASGAKVSGVRESSNIADAMKFASSPRFLPHSLPEYLGSLPNGSPYNFSSTISNMASNIGTAATEASDGRHIQGMASTRKVAEFNAGNGIPPNNGLYDMWNNSSLHQQPSSGSGLWQKTPPFVNGTGLPHMPGFAKTSPQMLRTQHIDHHVGSAPVVTASPWKRQHSFLGESPEASGFHLGSLGSGGFHGSWQLHSPDLSSHMFSHVGGNNTELVSNVAHSSPKKLSHVFPGNPTSLSKFDSTNEQMRNIYHHRSEANTNNADKKQYELDLGSILRGKDSRTTLMIKNIPNKYTSKMLLVAIDEHCRGTYDFLYLPIDFKNKCNVGYAFINMIDPAQIIPFYQAFNGKKWEKFNSEKVASLTYARIQGKASLIAHFQNSSLMNEDKRCRPILFHTDGPNAGDMEPFPVGANIRVRPRKSRTGSNNEDNRSQGSSSTLASGEESANGIDSSISS